MRYAVCSSIGNYFAGFQRFVPIGSEPAPMWSSYHANIFSSKEAAEGFITKYGKLWELHLVEMMLVSASVVG